MSSSYITTFRPSTASTATQLVAFKHIINLTAQKIGLRHYFLKSGDLKVVGDSAPAISQYWRRHKVDYDLEWLTYNNLAALCIATNAVTTLIDSAFQRLFSAGATSSAWSWSPVSSLVRPFSWSEFRQSDHVSEYLVDDILKQCRCVPLCLCSF